MLPDDGVVAGLATLFVVAAVSIARDLDVRSPGTFFALVWVIATAPAASLAADSISWASATFVALFVGAAGIGAALGSSPHPKTGWKRENSSIPPAWAIVGSGVGGSAGFAAGMLYVREGGLPISALMGLDGWISLAAQFSAARYNEDYLEPLTIRLALAALYFGALCAGVVAARAGSRSLKAIAGAPLVAAAILTLETTAKAPALLTSLLMGSSYLACGVRSGRTVSIGRWAAVGVLGAGLVVGSLVLRYSPDNPEVLLDVANALASYAMGHVGALTAWIAWDGPWTTSLEGGRNTVAGVFEVLGGARRQAGLYIPIELNELARDSNVFTALRGLVEDFSLPGAVLAVTALTFFSQRAFDRIGRSSECWSDVAVLTAYYSFVGFSPFISIFNYNSIIAAFAAFGVSIAVEAWRGAPERARDHRN